VGGTAALHGGLKAGDIFCGVDGKSAVGKSISVISEPQLCSTNLIVVHHNACVRAQNSGPCTTVHGYFLIIRITEDRELS